MEALEELGVVSVGQEKKAREVLVSLDELDDILANI